MGGRRSRGSEAQGSGSGRGRSGFVGARRHVGRRSSLWQVTARQIMTADDVRRAVIRISHEIVEKHGGVEGLALVGTQPRGVPRGERRASAMAKNEGSRPPVGSLD